MSKFLKGIAHNLHFGNNSNSSKPKGSSPSSGGGADHQDKDNTNVGTDADENALSLTSSPDSGMQELSLCRSPDSLNDQVNMCESPPDSDSFSCAVKPKITIPTAQTSPPYDYSMSPSDMDMTPVAPHGRRPSMLDRLPSQALSSSSERSEMSLSPATPTVSSSFLSATQPRNKVNASDLTSPLELIPSPVPREPALAIPAIPDRPSHSRIPSITLTDETPHSAPLSRTTSGITNHSTPSGFLAHRRTSSATRPHEVKETLSAHLSHSTSDDESELSESEESHSPVAKHTFRRLNQYRLGPVLGSGSAGTVEKALDTDTGTEYAVKEFSKSRLRKRKRSEALRVSRGRARQPAGLHEQGEDEKADALSLIRSSLLSFFNLFVWV